MSGRKDSTNKESADTASSTEHTAHSYTRKQLMGEDPPPAIPSIRQIAENVTVPKEMLGLKDCDNPACDRLTSSGAAFCCAGCADANGKYDPEGYHSDDCNERHEQRRPAPPTPPWLAKPRLPEPQDEGTIIGFQRQFGSEGPVYSYAAIKSPKGWHCTGLSGDPLRWSSLLNWIDTGQAEPPTLWAAVDFVEVDP